MFGARSALKFAKLSRMMSVRDALKVIRNSDKELSLFLKPIGRDIVLRGGTTDVYCFEKIFLHEEYKSPFADSEQPKLIIDGGANVGLASLYFAAKYPAANIFAIEPNAANFKMLERNCAALPNIVLKKAALWPTSAKVSMSKRAVNDHWSYSVIDAVNGDTDTITVTDIMREAKADKIDLLKLDIEGAERELFRNSPWLKDVGQIVIELHDRYKRDCSRSFYKAVVSRDFRQELRGENIFISFSMDDHNK